MQHMLRQTNTKAEFHDEKPEVPLSAAEIEAWRIEMNLPIGPTDEELLMQSAARDLTPRKRKK
jgi:hypothetical protein